MSQSWYAFLIRWKAKGIKPPADHEHALQVMAEAIAQNKGNLFAPDAWFYLLKTETKRGKDPVLERVFPLEEVLKSVEEAKQ